MNHDERATDRVVALIEGVTAVDHRPRAARERDPFRAGRHRRRARRGIGGRRQRKQPNDRDSDPCRSRAQMSYRRERKEA